MTRNHERQHRRGETTRDGINEERPRETASTWKDHKRQHQQGEPGESGESMRDSINNVPWMSNATTDRVVTMSWEQWV